MSAYEAAGPSVDGEHQTRVECAFEFVHREERLTVRKLRLYAILRLLDLHRELASRLVRTVECRQLGGYELEVLGDGLPLGGPVLVHEAREQRGEICGRERLQSAREEQLSEEQLVRVAHIGGHVAFEQHAAVHSRQVAEFAHHLQTRLVLGPQLQQLLTLAHIAMK